MRFVIRINIREELKSISEEIARLHLAYGFSAEEYLHVILLLVSSPEGATFEGFIFELKDTLDNSDVIEDLDYAYMLDDLSAKQESYRRLFDFLCVVGEYLLDEWVRPGDELIDFLIVPPLLELALWRN